MNQSDFDIFAGIASTGTKEEKKDDFDFFSIHTQPSKPVPKTNGPLF